MLLIVIIYLHIGFSFLIPTIPHFVFLLFSYLFFLIDIHWILYLRLILFVDILVRRSSTEAPSGRDADINIHIGFGRDHDNQKVEVSTTANIQVDNVKSKQKQDKAINKGRQDDEDEQGKIINRIDRLKLFVFIENLYSKNQ